MSFTICPRAMKSGASDPIITKNRKEGGRFVPASTIFSAQSAWCLWVSKLHHFWWWTHDEVNWQCRPGQQTVYLKRRLWWIHTNWHPFLFVCLPTYYVACVALVSKIIKLFAKKLVAVELFCSYFQAFKVIFSLACHCLIVLDGQSNHAFWNLSIWVQIRGFCHCHKM